MEKDDVLWALHWPKENIPDEVLAQYPDLQKVDRQIRQVEDSITLEGTVAVIQGISFDIRDFPMSDRIAQREFVRVVGISAQDIKDVVIGKKSWEVFHASEMVVIGIQKRLRTVINSDHNPYIAWDYGSLEEGDIVKCGNEEVTVKKHYGAHLMKYYRDGEDIKPILPSKFERVIKRELQTKIEVATGIGLSFNGNQLEMVFSA